MQLDLLTDVVTKYCPKCKETKPTTCYTKNKSRKDGLAPHCKQCRRKERKDYRAANLEKEVEQQKEYRKANKEKIAAQKREYRQANKDRIREYNRSYQESKRHFVNAWNAKRRAAKLEATPDWLTEEQLNQIKDIYWLAQDLKRITGEDYHVDHIVPLLGEEARGLHVPWNLQILPADINLSKGNRLEDGSTET